MEVAATLLGIAAGIAFLFVGFMSTFVGRDREEEEEDDY